MHVGPDANHGHYIAHIQELETGNWFKFSDEYVVPLDKKTRLNPPRPPGEDPAKKSRPSQPPAGGQNSNNAYMLVYMLRSSIEEIRRHEMREVVKRDAVRRASIQQQNAKDGQVAVGADTGAAQPNAPPPQLTPEATEGVPPLQRGKKRKNSTDSSGSSVEEIDYSDEYCYSNTRVFPMSFQPHLRTKIDKDNQEFDEELEEKKKLRHVSEEEHNHRRVKMLDLYKGRLGLLIPGNSV